MLFLSLASLLVVAVGAHQLYFFLLARKRRKSVDWESLLASVEAVDLEGIRAVADLFLSPNKHQLRLEPPVMWEMLGGVEGIERMRRNAEVMLDLCMYAARWGQEGELIAQLVRTDALYLKKAVTRIELMFWFGLGHRRAHFALMEAAGYYELMQRRLLGLYENTHVGLLPELKARLCVSPT